MTSEEWVILELSSRSEGEDPDLVKKAICASIRDAEVFIPAVVTQIGEDRVVHYLVDGYAFVRHTHPDSIYLKLEGSRYVQSVLTEMDGKHRRLSKIGTPEVDKMRQQVLQEVDQGIGVDDIVRITSGPYRGIEAAVIEEIPEQGMVQVFVSLRSKQSLVTLPRSFLVVVKRSPLSPIRTRLNALKSWAQYVRPLIHHPLPSLKILQKSYRHFEDIHNWRLRGASLWAILSFLGGSFDPKLREISSHLAKLELLTGWMKRGAPCWETTWALDRVLQGGTSNLRAQLNRVVRLEGLLSRVHNLEQDLDQLAYMVAKSSNGKTLMVQNILLDGHNLAYRCLLTPGLSNIRDEKGRLTGMIVGFLGALSALKKRHPEASLYVAWDGSSKRRKSVYGDYQAKREHPSFERNGFDQLAYLKEILSVLGVYQVFNAEEEADDVLASLVRGSLNGQENLIFSTDRDFLQLVTSTTMVLVPKVGSRKEIPYNCEAVERDYGVGPEKMVELRAFYGDSSDHLPGVPRVPKKVLRALLQAHGSVDKVYKSGLVGVSKNQYERLRSSEPQVRINRKLMTLVDVPVSTLDPDANPEAVSNKLQQIGVTSKNILGAFFRHRES